MVDMSKYFHCYEIHTTLMEFVKAISLLDRKLFEVK